LEDGKNVFRLRLRLCSSLYPINERIRDFFLEYDRHTLRTSPPWGSELLEVSLLSSFNFSIILGPFSYFSCIFWTSVGIVVLYFELIVVGCLLFPLNWEGYLRFFYLGYFYVDLRVMYHDMFLIGEAAEAQFQTFRYTSIF
jgi:hypothetical protein